MRARSTGPPPSLLLFWTLGGNRVGRAATSEWQEIVRPAILRGASVWLFDGELPDFVKRGGLVLAETYPADAYALLGAPFGSSESKTSRDHRRFKAAPILCWADSVRVDLAEVRKPLIDGFGVSKAGEDPFDALVGLLAMIPLVDGSTTTTARPLCDRARSASRTARVAR